MTRHHPIQVPQWIRLTLMPLLLLAPSTGTHAEGLLQASDRASDELAFDGTPALHGGTSTFLDFEDHAYVNPFTGGVPWADGQVTDAIAMEWAFVGVSEVLPHCTGAFNWMFVDDLLTDIAGRGHQAILRPVFFGPGYGNFAPDGMPVTDFV